MNGRLHAMGESLAPTEAHTSTDVDSTRQEGSSSRPTRRTDRQVGIETGGGLTHGWRNRFQAQRPRCGHWEAKAGSGKQSCLSLCQPWPDAGAILLPLHQALSSVRERRTQMVFVIKLTFFLSLLFAETVFSRTYFLKMLSLDSSYFLCKKLSWRRHYL